MPSEGLTRNGAIVHVGIQELTIRVPPPERACKGDLEALIAPVHSHAHAPTCLDGTPRLCYHGPRPRRWPGAPPQDRPR